METQELSEAIKPPFTKLAREKPARPKVIIYIIEPGPTGPEADRT